MAERLLSREEVLGGLPARRAATILHAIRSRTASLVARSRRPLGGYVGERTAAQRESEFLAALATGRDARVKPTIQDLERYSAEWASLVPSDAALRAAIAKRLGEEELVPRDRVPRLRAALGLDETAVREAYERATAKQLDTIYATALPLRERLRWRASRLAERLERMPPFWIAFSLTLTETVGSGILALPVAMAGIGPLGAAILLLIFGVINMITVAALAEAITRTGSMRYGTAYFGKLVSEHLGPLAVVLMNAMLLVLSGVILLVALIGFGSVLGSTIGLPAWVWVTLLFGANLVLLARERLDATIASALVIGAVNIGLIVAMSAVALGHARGENFEQVNIPLLDGRPVDTGVLALIFGVVLCAYFGHTSAANSAKVVLDRDPSGRALVWGNVAALAAAALLYTLMVLAFTGAVERSELEGAAGTALEPLAEHVGASIAVLGSAFAVLALGIGSVYGCLGLYNQFLELRPQRTRAARFAVGSAPAIGLCALALWLLATERQSFAGPLGYIGALTIPLAAGILPMLLVVASRRRGDRVPSAVPRVVGHGGTAAVLGAVFLAGVLLHALLIWDDPLARIAGLLLAAVMVVAVVGAWRRGAFRPRTVIELRREAERDAGHVAVTARGRPVTAAIELDGRSANASSFERFSKLRTATVVLPPDTPDEVHVWMHRVSPDSASEPVRADVVVDGRTVVITPAAAGAR